jgi:hypothetical protein
MFKVLDWVVIWWLREEVRLQLRKLRWLTARLERLLAPAPDQATRLLKSTETDSAKSSLHGNNMNFPYQCLVARGGTSFDPTAWTLFGATGSRLVTQSSNGTTSVWPQQDVQLRVSDACWRTACMQRGEFWTFVAA